MEQNNTPTSDEIDLGQLFALIRKGFHNLFKRFLRFFIFFKKNLIKLIVLIGVGIGIGLLVNNLVPKRLKTEVLVKPNFESKDYLYATIEEIGANIASRDSLFFKRMNIDIAELNSFSITIEPVEEVEDDIELFEKKNKYLETLQKFQNDEFVLNVIKSEILQNTVPIHRITFSFKNPNKSEEVVKKMLTYINENPYFKELQEISKKNTETRISNNEELINQIDVLMASYSKNLANKEQSSSQTSGMVLLDNESGLNITNLLNLKNRLIREIEDKRKELLEQSKAVNIQNLGKTQVVKGSLLSKNLVLFPSILIGCFVLLSLLVYFNKKAKELL